jgi:hypothetical protein
VSGPMLAMKSASHSPTCCHIQWPYLGASCYERNTYNIVSPYYVVQASQIRAIVGWGREFILSPSLYRNPESFFKDLPNGFLVLEAQASTVASNSVVWTLLPAGGLHLEVKKK